MPIAITIWVLLATVIATDTIEKSNSKENLNIEQESLNK